MFLLVICYLLTGNIVVCVIVCLAWVCWRATLLTTELFFEDGSSMWVDIFSVSKKPITLLSLPMVCESPLRIAHFPFPGPTDVDIPRATRLSPPNIFVSESTFLLNRVTQRGCGYPERCIFLKKKGAKTGPDGWECEYDGAFRPFLIPKAPQRRNASTKRGTLPHPTKEAVNTPPGGVLPSAFQSDSSDGERSVGDTDPPQSDSEGELRPYDIDFWYSDDEPGQTAHDGGNTTTLVSMPLIDRPRLLSNQRDLIFNRLCGDINQDKYSLLVNTLDAIVTVRWKQIEQTQEAWGKFTEGKTKAVGVCKEKKNSQPAVVARAHCTR